MFYVFLMVIAAFITGQMTKEFPQVRTRMGLVSLAVTFIALAIALVTGNLLLFYLGGSTLIYGLLVLSMRVAAAAFDRGDFRPLWPQVRRTKSRSASSMDQVHESNR